MIISSYLIVNDHFIWLLMIPTYLFLSNAHLSCFWFCSVISICMFSIMFFKGLFVCVCLCGKVIRLSDGVRLRPWQCQTHAWRFNLSLSHTHKHTHTGFVCLLGRSLYYTILVFYPVDKILLSEPHRIMWCPLPTWHFVTHDILMWNTNRTHGCGACSIPDHSRSPWRRRLLHSPPASCAGSQALHWSQCPPNQNHTGWIEEGTWLIHTVGETACPLTLCKHTGAIIDI